MSQSIKLPLYASVIVLIAYGIDFAGAIYEPIALTTGKLVNRDGAWSMSTGESPIEWLEAVSWLAASAVYLSHFLRKRRAVQSIGVLRWLLFLSAWCFVAFGEEVSWGQHIFLYEGSDFIEQINHQHETNLHNLRAFHDTHLAVLLQYGFYLGCAVLWLIIPVLQRSRRIRQVGIIKSSPSYSAGVIVFIGINIGIYMIVDFLIVDAGEIFELVLSLTAILSALDLRFVQPAAVTYICEGE